MEDKKLPLKRVELSLSKFNEVAIPHHLDLLRQHKANILKYEEAGDYARVRTEQTHARRVTSQLRSLLGELDALRRQVRHDDVTKFDDLTQRSRERTLTAVMDYLDDRSRGRGVVEEAGGGGGSVVSTESVGVLPQLQLQLEVDQQELEVRAREEALRGWAELQEELRALHEAWASLHRAALTQRGQVSTVDESVETAAVNVQIACSSLSASERLRAGAWGATGALVGVAVGGPLGLLLGGKIAALAALSGSLAGYVGGKFLGARRQLQIQEAETDQTDTHTDTHVDKSKDD